jgi:hypothetical protein
MHHYSKLIPTRAGTLLILVKAGHFLGGMSAGVKVPMNSRYLVCYPDWGEACRVPLQLLATRPPQGTTSASFSNGACMRNDAESEGDLQKTAQI